MPDIQFDRGHVNAQEAATGRFGGGGFARPVEGENGEFSFEDFLDLINPLQHIPIISTLYREITGDEISGPARIIGGTLFGGPTGFVSAVANTLFDEATGSDVGESVLALFDDDAEDSQLADAALPAAAATAMTAAPLETATGPTATTPYATSGAVAPGVVLPGGLIPAALVPTAAAGAPGKPVPPASGPEPPSTPGMLTGQDALNALFNDLRGPAPTRRAPEALPPSEPSPSAVLQQTAAPTAPPLRPSSSPSNDDKRPREVGTGRSVAAGDAAANPLILAAQAPDAALADQMLSALDKYRAMTEKRQQEQARARADEPPMLPSAP